MLIGSRSRIKNIQVFDISLGQKIERVIEFEYRVECYVIPICDMTRTCGINCQKGGKACGYAFSNHTLFNT